MRWQRSALCVCGVISLAGSVGRVSAHGVALGAASSARAHERCATGHASRTCAAPGNMTSS